MIPIFVPAQIHYAPKIEHHVLVESGSNWDLASVALVTPIVELRNPKPYAPSVSQGGSQAKQSLGPSGVKVKSNETVAPAPHISLIVDYAPGTAAISRSARDKLLLLSTSTPIFIRANSNAEKQSERLCKVRVSVLASMLRAYGYTVHALQPNCFVKKTPAPGSVEVFTYHPAA